MRISPKRPSRQLLASVYTRVRCLQTANASRKILIGLCLILAHFALLCPALPPAESSRQPETSIPGMAFGKWIIPDCLSLAIFGSLCHFVPRTESARHTDASIAAGDAMRPGRRLRNFPYSPYSQYSQYLSLSFTKFPLFDRVPNRADTLPRQYQSRVFLRQL